MYLVTEEDIERLKFCFKTFKKPEDALDEILKDKQPVELIFKDNFHYGEFIGDCEKKKYANLDKKLSDENGRNISIYISENKEG